ncbi:BREX-5 system adenine-specific DNA-methyltransferase PglX [Haloarcula amylovorans]|uniref:BREX-5 system adenine-specific DNA-methyltransferase PglX n=1 Tax=Haloarcula amylovorans TaxID=2562280 RepID=UPI0010761F0A|nr:BREX-5 system adenine-specific DNA-methyltransferase PglX [Halomicroarcula amylolytica]
MSDISSPQQKAQLDKAEREHLEDIVTEMRDRVEDNIRFRLTQQDLDEKPDDTDALDEEMASLVEAIELEAVDSQSWNDAFEQYVMSVGYTIVNRLAALRCMEVRDFIDEEVTVFKDNGLTPAAETLVHEEFLLEDEAILEAYYQKCDSLAEEIEILFDRSTAYSLIDPDDDTFEELCGLLDKVSDEVWRADDVLGWVYEYYNVKLLDDLRRKGDREGLEPKDVPPANQFYTPHWVVRMLTDNSLGKLYLEDKGTLQETVDAQSKLTSDERKNRPLSFAESPDIADFCTYLVPSEEGGEPTDFDHPKELRVIDPACGSGHFLLYAFDVLERIWRAETNLDPAAIPCKILRHNLYGVDLDMRACQLAAFNLYLKGRNHAESEGANDFDMPNVGIVCADARVADVEGVEEVFDEVADGKSDVKDALRRILNAFEEVHGLGSLLDVRGTLSDLFEDEVSDGSVQITLDDDPREDYTPRQILRNLREAVEKHRDTDSFLAQDLRSFVRLIDILTQDYDVALMNPPYGSQNRMPTSVQRYVEDHYKYKPEFYINFFEVCDNITKDNSRIGMLVPRTFMFKRSYREFRSDFIGSKGGFDFLSEFGLGVLDNATVRTVGTVVKSGSSWNQTGSFIRLHDISADSKETKFRSTLSDETSDDITRMFHVNVEAFNQVPWSPLSYYIPAEIRSLHSSESKLDPEAAGISATSIANAVQGMSTGNNDRFVRNHWETTSESFIPFAKGGSSSWILPRVSKSLNWNGEGDEIRRQSSSVMRNESLYLRSGLTWTNIKATGRRFGYLPPGAVFDQKGPLLVSEEISNWDLLAVINSDVYHGLLLSLTPERTWGQGDVGRLPWHNQLQDDGILGEMAKEQYTALLNLAITDPLSPYYIAPCLVPERYRDQFFYCDNDLLDNDKRISDLPSVSGQQSESVCERARAAEEERRRINREVEALAENIDQRICRILNIPERNYEQIRQEIFLRTAESPKDRKVPDPESVPEMPDNIEKQVKDLIHHFAMEAVREESDGIIPCYEVDGQANMFDRIVEQFENAYDEYAGDRLIEVDEILGNKSADDEAYPNLRTFVENDLFAYHAARMENTPIIWKLTTERLIADSAGEIFACFLDYHQIDAGTFDRLSNTYLEPRKAELRERRSAANRRRSDESLPTSEQAKAAKTYDQCASGLEQIAVFEEQLQALGDTSKRDFADEYQDLASMLELKVRRFRKDTENRLDALIELREMKEDDWFEDTFSPSFWEKVDEWRGEWIDALETLEDACVAYSKPTNQPVEAHLADLFDYFNSRLKGSDHYSSTGILFMTYYFESAGSDFVDADGEPKDGLKDEDAKRLATLATRLEEYKDLADEIKNDCETLATATPSDWADRALSEVTTAGYQPNHKHGVEINITPLAQAEIVPKTVDDDVL